MSERGNRPGPSHRPPPDDPNAANQIPESDTTGAVGDAADPPTSAKQRRVLSTTAGKNSGAFSTGDWLRFVSVGLIWGSAYLLIDIGLEAFAPGVIAWLRIALGAAVLWLLPRARPPVHREDWPRLVTVSVTWIAIPFTLFPLGQQYINSALTGMINSSMPIFATLIGSIMLARMPGSRQMLGLLIGIAGIVAMTAPTALSTRSEVPGVVMILTAVAFYGLAVNVAAPLQQRYGSIPVMARVLALAAIWTAPLGLLGVADSTFELGPALATALLGVLGTGLAFALMATLIGSVGAGRASFVTYLLPAVALLLGVTLRGDRVTIASLIGVALVLVGAFLASRRELPPTRPARIDPAETGR